jgi:hypothetical protein
MNTINSIQAEPNIKPGPAALREKILTGSKAPPMGDQLGKDGLATEIPAWLATVPRWTAWCWMKKDGRWGKLPLHWTGEKFDKGFGPSNPDHMAGLCELPTLVQRIKKASTRDSLGLMFIPGTDPDGTQWAAVDLDKVDPSSIPALVADHLASGYWCQTPSGYGIRIIGKVAGNSRRNGAMKGGPVDGELFVKNYVTVTAKPIAGSTAQNIDITNIWDALEPFVPVPPKPVYTITPSPMDSDPEFMAHLVECAQKYISKRAPAVSGSGGHNQFFGTCCIVTGDFGLRGEEGLALAESWNSEHCHPPFSRGDMGHKWVDALKKTEGQASKFRDEHARKWRPKWSGVNHQGNTRQEREPEPKNNDDIPDDCNHDGPDDVVVQADPRDQVIIRTGRAHESADQIVQILTEANLDLFEFGDRLSQVVQGDRAGEGGVRVNELPSGAIQSLIPRYCSLVKESKGKAGQPPELIPVDPPQSHLKIVETGRGFPVLVGLVRGPQMDADGTLFNGSGYDPKTKRFYACPVDGLEVPEAPTQADAADAAENIRKMVRFFPWAEDVDYLRWFAALMGCAMRQTFSNNPLLMFTGTEGGQYASGAGKSWLMDALHEILAPGSAIGVTLPGPNDEGTEIEKRLIALVTSGGQYLRFDDVREGITVNCAYLRDHLVNEIVTGRLLGGNRWVSVLNRVTAIMSGNGISPAMDMGQRTLIIRLDNDHEDRRGLKAADFGEIGNFKTFIRENRARILGWIFTIIKAWRQAGSPCPEGHEWANFQGWVESACAVTRWIYNRDPLDGAREDRAAAMDPVVIPATNFAIAWAEIPNLGTGRTAWVTPGTLADELNSRNTPDHQAMRDALEEMGYRPNQDGRWLSQTLTGALRKMSQFKITISHTCHTSPRIVRFQRDSGFKTRGNAGRWRLCEEVESTGRIGDSAELGSLARKTAQITGTDVTDVTDVTCSRQTRKDILPSTEEPPAHTPYIGGGRNPKNSPLSHISPRPAPTPLFPDGATIDLGDDL